MSPRTVIVTGGGAGGIGAGIAAVLARAGHRVVVAGRTREKLEQTCAAVPDAPIPLEPFVADVTRAEEREALVAASRERFGGVDVLVNSATVTALEPLLDYRESSWREVLAINLDACFFLAQLAIEQMRAKGWGRIVNVGSVYGQVALDNHVYAERLPLDAGGRGPVRESAYAAAKGAVRQLTRELAVACAPWGVTVNSVVPGMFPVDPGGIDPAVRARMLERIPLGRFGAPEEIGHAVAYLASEQAGYVTGTELLVDGGWTAW